MKCEHKQTSIVAAGDKTCKESKRDVVCDDCGEIVGEVEWKRTGPASFELVTRPLEDDDEHEDKNRNH